MVDCHAYRAENALDIDNSNSKGFETFDTVEVDIPESVSMVQCANF